MAIERFKYGGQNFSKVVDRGFIQNTLVRLYGNLEVRRRTNAQGLGVHTRHEVFHLVKKDLMAVSTLLGDKPFLLGDKPCLNDCSIFGHLLQFVLGLPNSPYEQLIEGNQKRFHLSTFEFLML
jgi:glutathione S-transferase